MGAPVNQPERQQRITRRRFLGVGAVSCGAVLGYTHWIEPFWIDWTTVPMPLEDLPDHWVGKRVAFISDLHVGPTRLGYLERAIDQVGGLQADMLLIGGDFMSAKGHEHVDRVGRLFDRLTTPPLGAWAIPGNHDYTDTYRRIDVRDALAARLGLAGVRMLRNEAVDVQGLTLIGLEDFWSPAFRYPLAKSLLWSNPSGPVITLCHNPDTCDEPIWGDYRSWILSGHTHGGQCKPPFLPPPKLPVRNRMYTSGRFDLSGGRTLYISRGLGMSMQVRFNVRPEVTVFELCRA